MARTPVFHRQNKKLQSSDFFRNVWCPDYDTCLKEAAIKDFHLDCGACAHGSVGSREDRLKDMSSMGAIYPVL